MGHRMTGLIFSCSLIFAPAAPAAPAQAQRTVPVQVGASHSSEWNHHGPTLIEFDAPGAITMFSPSCLSLCGTVPNAINVFGLIAGTYNDASFVNHGFVRLPRGRIFSFDAPGAGHGPAQGTVAYGINDFNYVVGQFTDARSVSQGFVRSPDGYLRTIGVEGAGTAPGEGIFAYDINIDGEVAGSYIDARNVYHGFARSPRGKTVSFDPAGSTSTFVCQTTCLNSDGAIAGSYLDAALTYHGFVRKTSGRITTIDVPGAATRLGHGTQVSGINRDGTITGFYEENTAELTEHGFIRYPNGHIDIVDAGGAGTEPFSINVFGSITGVVVEALGAQNGFVRTPRGAITVFSAPAAMQTHPTSINLEGVLCGSDTTADGVTHGFIRVP